MCSKTQPAGCAGKIAWYERMPRSSIVINSPGLTSRSRVAPQLIERAGLGSDDVASADLADAQGPHAVGIARGHEPIGRQQHDRVGDLDVTHERAESHLPCGVHIILVLAELQEILGQYFRVGRGLEGCTALGQIDPDLGRVDDVAVVRDGDLTSGQGVVKQDWLGVAEAAGAGGRVSGVANGRDALKARPHSPRRRPARRGPSPS